MSDEDAAEILFLLGDNNRLRRHCDDLVAQLADERRRRQKAVAVARLLERRLDRITAALGDILEDDTDTAEAAEIEARWPE